jgi:protein-disulfide isomerase
MLRYAFLNVTYFLIHRFNGVGMFRRFSLVALASGLALSSLCTPVQAEMSEKQFEEMMEKYLASDTGREEVGKTVERFIRESQQKAAAAAQEAAAAEVDTYLKNPIKIDVGDSPTKGPKNAPITIIEFSDYECPFCKRGADTIEAVLKEYNGKVRLAFKNLPLSFHANARPAAKAALAAGEQGKYWEFHDELFNNQRTLGEELYISIAQKLKLDVEKFKKDMQKESYDKLISKDEELAKKLDIQGTPGFVVGGVPVKGAYPFAHFKKIIDQLLKKK